MRDRVEDLFVHENYLLFSTQPVLGASYPDAVQVMPPIALLGWMAMASAPSEPLSQRLAAIREQLTLLSDYL
jgi:hypothetical protein